MNNNQEQDNLLQEVFDLIWYKIFPKDEKIEIPDIPEIPDKIDYKLPKRNHGQGIKIPIGEGLKGPIVLDLKKNPHSYIVGTTGSGKSVCSKSILTSLITTYSPRELEIYLADPKRVELSLFRNTKHCKKFVYEIEDITTLVADLLEETNKRYDLFMEKEVTSIFEYNRLPGVTKLKYQVLFVEEIVLLLMDPKKRAMRLLKQLTAISRASGLYVFLTTQRPDNTVIDNVVKANINNRICFKVEDTKNSIVALDKEGAELLPRAGRGLIKRGYKVEEFQGYYISDKQVKEIIAPYKRNKQLVKGIVEKPKNSNNKATCTKQEKNIIDLSFLNNL